MSMEKFLVKIEDGKTPAIVVDIDGTIANISGRLARARDEAGVTEEEVADTRSFYRDDRRYVFFDELFNPQAIMQLDEPIVGAVPILEYLSEHFTIFYVTSRPKERKMDSDNAVYSATAQWLDMHNFPTGTLVVRPREQRKDAFFIATYAELIERDYQIAFGIDDMFDGRAQYEAYGIRVIEIKNEKFVLPPICIEKDGSEICLAW